MDLYVTHTCIAFRRGFVGAGEGGAEECIETFLVGSIEAAAGA